MINRQDYPEEVQIAIEQLEGMDRTAQQRGNIAITDDGCYLVRITDGILEVEPAPDALGHRTYQGFAHPRIGTPASGRGE